MNELGKIQYEENEKTKYEEKGKTKCDDVYIIGKL
jgi:hypothetical protein